MTKNQPNLIGWEKKKSYLSIFEIFPETCEGTPETLKQLQTLASALKRKKTQNFPKVPNGILTGESVMRLGQ